MIPDWFPIGWFLFGALSGFVAGLVLHVWLTDRAKAADRAARVMPCHDRAWS